VNFFFPDDKCYVFYFTCRIFIATCITPPLFPSHTPIGHHSPPPPTVSPHAHQSRRFFPVTRVHLSPTQPPPFFRHLVCAFDVNVPPPCLTEPSTIAPRRLRLDIDFFLSPYCHLRLPFRVTLLLALAIESQTRLECDATMVLRLSSIRPQRSPSLSLPPPFSSGLRPPSAVVRGPIFMV